VQGQILLTAHLCESGLPRQAATKPFALTCMLQLSIFFSSHGSTALVALGLLYKVLWSHSDTTHSMTPLGEWSDCRSDLYLTAHNSHNRLTSMPRSKSEPQSVQASAADTHLRLRGHCNRPAIHPYIMISAFQLEQTATFLLLGSRGLYHLEWWPQRHSQHLQLTLANKAAKQHWKPK